MSARCQRVFGQERATRVRIAPLYRTHLVRPATPPEGDVVVLASGSAARSFAELGTEIPAVSIGPQTTHAATSAGLTVIAEAETHDLDGLIAAIGALPSS